MAIGNPDFAVAGAASYDAAGWTRASSGTNRYAVFAGLNAEGETVESFEQVLLAALPVTEPAFFDTSGDTPKGYEDFEDLWGARPATLVTGTRAPFALTSGMTLEVVVEGGEPELVTFERDDFFDFAHVGAEELARVIDRQLDEADARMTRDGRGVEILTAHLGQKVHLQVTGGTANAVLAFPTDVVTGTPEGGGFYRIAEFDLAPFADSSETETETFGRSVVKTFSFTLQPVSTLEGVLVRTNNTYTLLAPETFVDFDLVLTTNF